MPKTRREVAVHSWDLRSASSSQDERDLNEADESAEAAESDCSDAWGECSGDEESQLTAVERAADNVFRFFVKPLPYEPDFCTGCHRALPLRVRSWDASCGLFRCTTWRRPLFSKVERTARFYCAEPKALCSSSACNGEIHDHEDSPHFACFANS